MEAFIYPVVLSVIIAAIASVMLSLAAKFLAVPTDETAEKIRECLSGANCGACGYAGCDDYAAALAADRTLPSNLCVPGGDASATKIAAVLGQEAMDVIEKVAVIHCSGICDVTKPEMEYQGYSTCKAVKGFFGGPGSCKFGCIGLGDCSKVCPKGAITVCNGIAKVDRKLCVGCGMCANVCPQKLIEITPLKSRVSVGCSSADKGKITKELCDRGCIGCKLCEKECKFDAIHVIGNHAVIDYDKCRSCGMCSKVCPRGIITVFAKDSRAAHNPAAPKAQQMPTEIWEKKESSEIQNLADELDPKKN